MTEKEKIEEKRKFQEEHEFAILPTGADRTIQLLKHDTLELVYYFKKPIEDILGNKWKEAEESGNPQDYYLDWTYHLMNDGIMHTDDTYPEFLKNMYEYVQKHGIWKDSWKA